MTTLFLFQYAAKVPQIQPMVVIVCKCLVPHVIGANSYTASTVFVAIVISLYYTYVHRIAMTSYT